MSGSNTLIIDKNKPSIVTESPLVENGSRKCILKLDGRTIMDIQETRGNIFNCNISKIKGKKIDAILPEFQADGNNSKSVINSILQDLKSGKPVSTTGLAVDQTIETDISTHIINRQRLAPMS
jgi:hypothetical protein